VTLKEKAGRRAQGTCPLCKHWKAHRKEWREGGRDGGKKGGTEGKKEGRKEGNDILEKAKTQDSTKTSGYQGSWEGGEKGEKGSTGDCGGSKALLYDTVMVNTQTFSI
jgi:hypothetical protein